MKLIVFGATGGIGTQVVQQALDAGHEVTALARQPAAMTLRHERLDVIQGDALKPDTFRESIARKDAVISALGVRHLAPTTLFSEGVANIVQAMQTAHVRRLLCVSSSGLELGPRWQRWLADPLLWLIFRNMYTDLVRMETVVKASGLDWTILRPPTLTNGPRTGRYQAAINRHLSRSSFLARADVADYIINHLNDRATYCMTVEMSY